MMNRFSFYMSLMLFFLFMLIGGGVLLLHSSFAREKAINYLVDSLRSVDWGLSYERIDGSLANDVVLSKANLTTSKGDIISMEEVRLKLSLWGLLRREIALKKLFADTVIWKGSKVPSDDFSLSKNLPISLRVKQFTLDHVLLSQDVVSSIHGSFFLSKRSKKGFLRFVVSREDDRVGVDLKLFGSQMLLAKGDLALSSLQGTTDLHILSKGPLQSYVNLLQQKKLAVPIQGIVRGSVVLQKTPSLSWINDQLAKPWDVHASILATTEGEFQFSQISLLSKESSIHGSLTLSSSGELLSSSLGVETKVASFMMNLQRIEHEKKWAASCNISGTFLEKPWTYSSEVVWKNHESLQLEKILLESPLLSLQGNLEFFQPTLFNGNVTAKIFQLHDFTFLDASFPFYGSLQTQTNWTVQNDKQELSFDVVGSSLFYHYLQVKDAVFYGTISDFFQERTLDASCSLEDLQYQELMLQRTDLSINKNQTFEVSSEGTFREPTFFHAQGTFSHNNSRLLLDVKNLTGSILSFPLYLSSPAHFELGTHQIYHLFVDGSLGDASYVARMSHTEDLFFLKLLVQQFPANLLSTQGSGQLNIDVELEKQPKKTKGTLRGSIENRQALQGSGEFLATLQDERLSFTLETPSIQLSSDLPLELALSPLELKIKNEEPLQINFLYEGQVEELLDFFDLGANHLEGFLKTSLSMQGTLQHPILSGSALFQDGTYENYFTGMRLANITAHIEGKDSSLQLLSLEATDSMQRGKLFLTGSWNALAKDRYPFFLDGSFSRLDLTDIAWAKAEAGGSIHVIGNKDLSKISGEVIVLEGDMSIPDRISSKLPDLQVTYVNAPKPADTKKTSKNSSYPLFFDVHIHAPDSVFVTGRGLSSEWKGDLQLGGTYASLEAKGRLELLVGQFGFSGNFFKITEGSLQFSGKPHEFPIIDVAASLDFNQVLIIARLKGFLDAPQLFFQSVPSMPMGSILAYLLFKEDLSTMNALQAAQLVNSISTLSGQGLKILEQTKNSLHVDRLRIIATPLGDDGGETYSLQVGKYVSRGVLISVSQGYSIGNNSLGIPNLSVEVDLHKGFSLEAESQSEQQQGKFSLKWNVVY